MGNRSAHGRNSLNKICHCEQWFDLRNLFNKFKCQFDTVASSHGIVLEIFVAEQTPGNFYGDPLRLNDILKNLFTYALNHLDGGCIIFNVQATPAKQNDYRLDITMTTSGAGIPSYNFNKIFLPSTVTGGQGHGSLYIAKTLAVLMRGDLTVENTFGWGTNYRTHLIMKAEEPVCYDYIALEAASCQSYAHAVQ
jgi:signal transduction histidine kinase